MTERQTGEHPATTGDVKRWGMAQIGSMLGILAVVLPAGWFIFRILVSQALASDGGHVTMKDVQQVQVQVEQVQRDLATNDAGLRVEMQQMRAEQKQDIQRVETKVDRLIDLMLKDRKAR